MDTSAAPSTSRLRSPDRAASLRSVQFRTSRTRFRTPDATGRLLRYRPCYDTRNAPRSAWCSGGQPLHQTKPTASDSQVRSVCRLSYAQGLLLSNAKFGAAAFVWVLRLDLNLHLATGLDDRVLPLLVFQIMRGLNHRPAIRRKQRGECLLHRIRAGLSHITILGLGHTIVQLDFMLDAGSG